ncbi:MraY-like glycosyltransferase [Aquisphaera giovannonii]|uniref:MraY-like glycosyltransferase n=1 Tax=Aquisphaera giovannonii TaxID=406548 RepID=A0A5B9VXS0_9BACT|nr:hypothetical protein [Aquisphaera giovannonii]QEH32767.1 MraY-like glycosyltransferase [Aquisphaera giovannonii]
MDATFRLARKNRNVGLGGILGFTAALALTLYVAWTDPKIRDPRLLVVLAGGFYMFMTGLSALLLASYYCQRLMLRGERVQLLGLFQSIEVDLCSVTRARWRPGELTLWDNSTRLTIDFRVYQWSREERDELIRVVRSALDPEIQTGWDLFAYKMGYGLPRRPPGEPGPAEVLLTRSLWTRYFLPLVILAVVGGVTAWRLTGNPRFLTAPSAPLLLWGVLRYTTPAEGIVSSKIHARSVKDAGRFLVFLLVWGTVGIAAIIWASWPGWENQPIPFIVTLVIWMSVLLYEAAREDRRTARRDREAAELAAKARGERGRQEVGVLE